MNFRLLLAGYRYDTLFRIPVLLMSLVAITLVVAGCTNDTDSGAIPSEIPFRGDGILDFRDAAGKQITRIAIEIAEGDSARARGLMNRRSLPARGGMLFLSDEEKEQSFWMKNTPLPLDILFISADSQVVKIVRRTTPLSEETINSDGPAQYVLEVRAGFCDKYGLSEGNRVSWNRVSN